MTDTVESPELKAPKTVENNEIEYIATIGLKDGVALGSEAYVQNIGLRLS